MLYNSGFNIFASQALVCEESLIMRDWLANGRIFQDERNESVPSLMTRETNRNLGLRRIFHDKRNESEPSCEELVLYVEKKYVKSLHTL